MTYYIEVIDTFIHKSIILISSEWNGGAVTGFKEIASDFKEYIDVSNVNENVHFSSLGSLSDHQFGGVDVEQY